MFVWVAAWQIQESILLSHHYLILCVSVCEAHAAHRGAVTSIEGNVKHSHSDTSAMLWCLFWWKVSYSSGLSLRYQSCLSWEIQDRTLLRERWKERSSARGRTDQYKGQPIHPPQKLICLDRPFMCESLEILLEKDQHSVEESAHVILIRRQVGEMFQHQSPGFNTCKSLNDVCRVCTLILHTHTNSVDRLKCNLKHSGDLHSVFLIWQPDRELLYAEKPISPSIKVTVLLCTLIWHAQSHQDTGAWKCHKTTDAWWPVHTHWSTFIAHSLVAVKQDQKMMFCPDNIFPVATGSNNSLTFSCYCIHLAVHLHELFNCNHEDITLLSIPIILMRAHTDLLLLQRQICVLQVFLITHQRQC